MTLRVSGKNMDIGDALRSQVQARIASALSKFIDGARYTGHVTVCKDGTGYRTDCVLHLSSGVTIEAQGDAYDAQQSFADAADKIEKRLKRHKSRLRGHNGGQDKRADGIAMASYILRAPDEDDEELGSEEAHPAVVAETTQSLHRLSVSDAVNELDLTGAPVVVFRHGGNDRVNVVYRRRDGMIGWIDPPAATGR
jgi:ribosomal subunit interface protein